MKLDRYVALGDARRHEHGRTREARSRSPGGERVTILELGRDQQSRFARLLRLSCLPGFMRKVEWDRTEDGAYLVLARSGDATLGARLSETGPLPVQEALRLGRELAASLARAHRHGLVHGALRSGSVFLENDGTPVIELTPDVASEGTPSMDVQALGAILRECLGGIAPPERERLRAPGWLVSVVERSSLPAAEGGYGDAVAVAEALRGGSCLPRIAGVVALLLLVAIGLALALAPRTGRARPPVVHPWAANVTSQGFNLKEGVSLGRISVDGDLVAISSGGPAYGHFTTVVINTSLPRKDAESSALVTTMIGGAVLHPRTHGLVGYLEAPATASLASTVHVVAVDSERQKIIGSAKVAQTTSDRFSSGYFCVDSVHGRIYAGLQGGDYRDPLVVLDVSEITSAGSTTRPLRLGGVMGGLLVDERSGRAYVTVSNRTLVLGPPPALLVERELPDLFVAAVDPVRGRLFAVSTSEMRLVVVERDDPPRMTAVPAPGAVAIDTLRNRLYVAEAAPGRVSVFDGDRFELVAHLVIDNEATRSLLAIDSERRRLHVAVEAGVERRLYVLDLP